MSSRVLRDELWTSERVNSLHDKTFRLYLCLFNSADDYGLVETGFGEIRRAAPLLPWTREEVSKMLGELVDAGLILPYEVSQKSYAAVERWQCYVRATKPRNPPPSFGLGHCRQPYGFKDHRTKIAASLILKHLAFNIAPLGQEGIGGLGEEGKKGVNLKPKGDARATRFACPSIPPEWAEYCRERRPGLDPASVFENFSDFWTSKPGKDGRKLDWFATWRGWVRNEKELPLSQRIAPSSDRLTQLFGEEKG